MKFLPLLLHRLAAAVRDEVDLARAALADHRRMVALHEQRQENVGASITIFEAPPRRKKAG